MSPALRRRYERLLAAYPSDWRMANGTVVLDTLLEAAGPGQRWPSLREAVALLTGGIRARVHQPAAGDPGQRWVDGLYFGAILLAMWSLALAAGAVVSWLAHGSSDPRGSFPAYDSVWAVMAAVIAVSVLRGRIGTALVATAVWVPASVLLELAATDPPAGGIPDGPATMVWRAVVGALPLLAVLTVLVRRGGVRPHPWLWLLPPVALGISAGLAPLLWAAAGIMMLVLLVGALALAVGTGEVRPALALVIFAVPSLLVAAFANPAEHGLHNAWGGTLSSTPGALAVAALAAWGAVRAHRGGSTATSRSGS